MSERIQHINNKKHCQKCKEWKLTSEYNKDKSRWDDLHPWCRVCWNKQQKEYHLKNKNKVKLRQKKYYNSWCGRYTSYKATAKQRKLDFTLTKTEFAGIISQPCYYCGELAENFNGVDRVDSNKGYEVSNCVPCCWECNKMKNDTSKKEFIKKCKQIVEKQEVMAYSK